MQNKKILIVGNDEEMRFTISFILKRYGFQLESADNGELALEVIKSSLKKGILFDLIIWDINTPLINSSKLIYILKELKKLSPLLMVTDPQTTKHLQKASDIGSLIYLEKPFQPQDLQKKVNRFFRNAIPLITNKKII